MNNYHFLLRNGNISPVTENVKKTFVNCNDLKEKHQTIGIKPINHCHSHSHRYQSNLQLIYHN